MKTASRKENRAKKQPGPFDLARYCHYAVVAAVILFLTRKEFTFDDLGFAWGVGIAALFMCYVHLYEGAYEAVDGAGRIARRLFRRRVRRFTPPSRLYAIVARGTRNRPGLLAFLFALHTAAGVAAFFLVKRLFLETPWRDESFLSLLLKCFAAVALVNLLAGILTCGIWRAMRKKRQTPPEIL